MLVVYDQKCRHLFRESFENCHLAGVVIFGFALTLKIAQYFVRNLNRRRTLVGVVGGLGLVGRVRDQVGGADGHGRQTDAAESLRGESSNK